MIQKYSTISNVCEHGDDLHISLWTISINGFPEKIKAIYLKVSDRVRSVEDALLDYLDKHIDSHSYIYTRNFTVNNGETKHKLICNLPKRDATYNDFLKAIGNSGKMLYKHESDLYYQDLSSRKDYSIFQKSRDSIAGEKDMIATKEEFIPSNTSEEV